MTQALAIKNIRLAGKILRQSNAFSDILVGNILRDLADQIEQTGWPHEEERGKSPEGQDPSQPNPLSPGRRWFESEPRAWWNPREKQYVPVTWDAMPPEQQKVWESYAPPHFRKFNP